MERDAFPDTLHSNDSRSMPKKASSASTRRPFADRYDHVRGYSMLDFKDRLAPFHYEEALPSAFLTDEELARFQIPYDQVIYLCHKR